MEDDNLDPNDQSPTHYQMPDGRWMSFWVASDYRLSEWSYFWVSFPGPEIPPAWYRVYKVETAPPGWKPMKPRKKVYQKTGFDDADDERDGDDNFQLSAAEKLRMGKYRLEVKIRIAERDYEIGGLAFKVLGEHVKAAPPATEAGFSMNRPRCSASAVASLIKLPKLAVRGLSNVALLSGLNAGPNDLYPEYMRVNGQRVAEYPWPGIVLVTLLSYLREKHQITLMKSEHDKVSRLITEKRKVPQFIFTDAHRRAFLAKLDGQFPEPEMRDYFRQYNEVDDPEAGRKMLDGIRALRQSLSTLDENSVILFSIG
ncbi:MAG TPA: hypothetical protein VK815_13195 [Candidatus Acidoferrales bacterium]|jgi:hypothetical protein|nr:hypothetical protein [Candidatus Acidoferrales bacterium]